MKKAMEIKKKARKVITTAALAMAIMSSASTHGMIMTTLAADIGYKTHVAAIGWLGEVKNGAQSGTTGESRQAECWTARIIGVGGGIRYRSHVANKGTLEWRKDNEPSGTTGEGLRLEAIQAELYGEADEKYYLEYRTHVQEIGWTNWIRSGWSGTIGQSRRVEAIEMRLVAKDGGDGGGGNVIINTLDWSKAKNTYKNKSTWNGSYKNKAWQCQGWACTVADMVTGTDPYTWSRKSSLEDLKPGDIIRFKRPHSIIVTGVSKNNITYAECNWAAPNQVTWDQTIDRNSLTSKYGTLDYVMSCPK